MCARVDGSLLTQPGVCVRGRGRCNLIIKSLFHYVLQIFAQSATRHNNIQFTSIFSVSHDMYTLHDDTSISIIFRYIAQPYFECNPTYPSKCRFKAQVY